MSETVPALMPVVASDPSLYGTNRRADYLDTLADIDDRQIAPVSRTGIPRHSTGVRAATN